MTQAPFPASTIAPRIASHLDSLSVQYDMLIHEDTLSLELAAASLNLPEYMVARAVVLRDHDFICMAVLPLNTIIDFVELRGLTQRDLQPVAINFVNEMFPDCEPGTIPPFGGMYNMDTFYDSSLLNVPAILFEAGDHKHFIRLTQDEFRRVVESNHHGSFAKSLEALRVTDRNNKPMTTLPQGVNLAAHYRQFAPLTDERKYLDAIEGLPVVPGLTNELQNLRNNPQLSTTEVAEIISRQEDFAEQWIHYATVVVQLVGKQDSPGQLVAATSQALGRDLSLALAIGLSVYHAFNLQPLGPIGKRTLMSQAVLTACLSLRIYDQLLGDQQGDRTQLFLAALLHNFGFVLYGYLFKSKYYLLNKLVQTNPEIRMVEFESLLSRQVQETQQTTGHGSIAAKVFSAWHMPDSVVVTAMHHHDPDYQGPEALYANLVLLANTLLKPHSGGDATLRDLPEQVLDGLGLTARDLNTLTEQMIDCHVDSAMPINRAFHPI